MIGDDSESTGASPPSTLGSGFSGMAPAAVESSRHARSAPAADKDEDDGEAARQDSTATTHATTSLTNATHGDAAEHGDSFDFDFSQRSDSSLEAVSCC